MKQLSLYAAGPVMVVGMVWFLVQEPTPELTQPIEMETPWAQPDDPRVVDFQPVVLNETALEQLIRTGGDVVLPLADGERLTLRLEEAEPTATGGRVHRGSVVDEADSVVLLVEEEGLWAGSVDLADGRFFNLLHAGMGRYRLETVDLARAPICEKDGAPLPDAAGELTEEGGVMAHDKARMLTVRRPPNRPVQEAPTVSSLGRYIRINLRIHPRRTISQPVKKPLFTLRPKPNAAVTTTQSTNRVRGVHPPGGQGQGGGTRVTGTGGSTGGSVPGTIGTVGGNIPGGTRPQPSGRTVGGDVIDLLMVYSIGAEKGYGGVTGIKSAMQLAVQQANTAFAQSGTSVRLNLVHTAPIHYRSVGRLGSDLHNVTFKDKALSAHLEGLRKKHRADLVSVVSSTGGGGVGWLLIKPSGMRRFGYHVLGAGSLRGYVLAHEVGHNLGCQHARGDSGVVANRALFSFGYGYRFHASTGQGAARNYRTVMAYAPGRRVGHFSNPTKSYRNVPTGTARDNNAAVLRKTVSMVSSYY